MTLKTAADRRELRPSLDQLLVRSVGFPVERSKVPWEKWFMADHEGPQIGGVLLQELPFPYRAVGGNGAPASASGPIGGSIGPER